MSCKRTFGHGLQKKRSIASASRNYLIGALAFLCSSSASVARAGDEMGVDEVSLKNGGTIRGTIVTVEPGSKVVITESGSKEPRTLAWAEVADVEKGKYEKKADNDAVEPGEAGPGYEAPIPEEEPAPSGPGVVRVHIESEEPVTLYERGATTVFGVGRYVAAVTQVRAVCESPCDKVIDGSRGQQFFIGGTDIPESSTFKLRDRTGDTNVDVSPGNRGQRTAGVWMTIIGATGVAAGAATLPLGFADLGSGEDDTLKIAGGVSLGAGAALLASGIAVFVTGRTAVELDTPPKRKADESASSAEHFAIDERPAEVRPRYWRGEF
ncbi:MAG: hypothetical protein HOW73_24750 [Polyangiaceae bacterium]|nr:hypothetical protein [Polyangiaceae bacterium]